MQQRPYTRNRLIEMHSSGFYIITPKEEFSNIPLCCPVCNLLMRSKEDEIAYNDLKCCDRCSMSWAASRREKWKSGWRPSLDDIQQNVNQRPSLIVNIDVD